MTTAKMDGSKNLPDGDYITHFFVTVIQTKQDSFDDLNGYSNKEYSRCWGYTDTFEKAEKAVLENYTDIHECSYQWAIIEEHVMDIFAIVTGRFQWYHWDRNKESYERCKQPDWAKQICGWGIG